MDLSDLILDENTNRKAIGLKKTKLFVIIPEGIN